MDVGIRLAADILDEPAGESGQFRLTVEERLLCVIMYARALKKKDIVKAIVHGEAPPLRGDTGYDSFYDLHQELITEMAKGETCYQKYTREQKKYEIPSQPRRKKRVLCGVEEEEDPADLEDPANDTGPVEAAPCVVPQLKGRKRRDLSRQGKG